MTQQVWTPTMELRWERDLVYDADSCQASLTLQQRWFLNGTGESEWRDVPVVSRDGRPYMDGSSVVGID